MTVGRILITSKRPGLAADPRRSAAGCYCRRAVRYKSQNTVYRPWEPCHYCKTHFKVSEEKLEEAEDVLLSPALSSETLQRVQSIDYTPRSEFLKKVQRKVSEQFSDRRSQIFDEISQNSAHFPQRSEKNQNTRKSPGYLEKNNRNPKILGIADDELNLSEENEENGGIGDNSPNFRRARKNNYEISSDRQDNREINTNSSSPSQNHHRRRSRRESSRDDRNSSINPRNSSYIEKIREIELVNLRNNSTIVDSHPGELIQVPVEIHRARSPTPSETDEAQAAVHKSRSYSLQKTSSTNVHQSRNSHQTSQTLRDFSPEIETILPPKSSRNKPKKTISSINRQKQQQTNKSTRLAEKNDQISLGKVRAKSTENLRKKSSDNLREKLSENSRDSNIIRTISQKSCQDMDCLVNKRKNKKSKKSSKCDCCDRCTSHLTISPVKCNFDEKTLELRKFREKNYFDTHQSRHEMHPCSSASSLEQFELNDRLFPESRGKINREDVVVTMPPCLTSDFKRIHYFPRCIVREDRKTRMGSKKRCKSCPLTGHSLDLGILKAPVPANSLALKHQKGVI